MVRPSVSLAARLTQFTSSTSAMATRTSTRVVSMVKNSPCVLCQHRLRPSSNIRHFHQSRVLPFSTSDNATPSNDAGATSEDASGPLLQPPDNTNHYTIFPKTFPNGPPPASPFAISVPDLRREFLSLQALVHPDKFPSGPAKERAEALSARINEAYRTLSDPLSRAQYLLAHNHGIDVMAEDGAQKHPQDADTLMQVLEAQEAIEEAEDEATIAELKSENGQRIDRCVAELGQAFDRGDVEQARDECVKLKFWYNIRDCLRDWEPGMKEVKLVH